MTWPLQCLRKFITTNISKHATLYLYSKNITLLLFLNICRQEQAIDILDRNIRFSHFILEDFSGIFLGDLLACDPKPIVSDGLWPTGLISILSANYLCHGPCSCVVARPSITLWSHIDMHLIKSYLTNLLSWIMNNEGIIKIMQRIENNRIFKMLGSHFHRSENKHCSNKIIFITISALLTVIPITETSRPLHVTRVEVM